MSELESLIKSMGKEGKSPRAIATELYDLGLKNNAGKFLSPEMIEGYLRQTDTQPPTVLLPPDPVEDVTEPAAALCSLRRRRLGIRKPWPEGVNYAGENCFPDEPPYNHTHWPVYAASPIRGASSAATAAMDGGA